MFAIFAPILARFGLESGLKLGRGLVVALVIGALYAAGGIGFWRGMAAIERMEFVARITAIAERDAHWQAEIAKSNAEVERLRAASAIAAARASFEAEQTISGLRAALTELETKNASLPNGGACGLDAGRVRLLDPTR